MQKRTTFKLMFRISLCFASMCQDSYSLRKLNHPCSRMENCSLLLGVYVWKWKVQHSTIYPRDDSTETHNNNNSIGWIALNNVFSIHITHCRLSINLDVRCAYIYSRLNNVKLEREWDSVRSWLITLAAAFCDIFFSFCSVCILCVIVGCINAWEKYLWNSPLYRILELRRVRRTYE